MQHSMRATTLSIESIEQFLGWCYGRGLSQNTVKAYRSDLIIFLKQSGVESIPLERIEYSAQLWLNLTRASLAPSTTGRRLTSIKVWARWAGDPAVLTDYVAPERARGMAHPIPEGKDGLLRMIAEAVNPQQVAIVGLTGFAGCRITEARSVRPSWFNLHDMLLTIRGKGDKTRIVPISTDAWDAVSEALVDARMAGDDRPLVRYSDRPARKVITTLGEKAGLSRPVSSHDMRHTFGSAVFNKTLNLRLTQELLGHGNSSTTEIYTGVTQAAMREAVQF